MQCTTQTYSAKRSFHFAHTQRIESRIETEIEQSLLQKGSFDQMLPFPMSPRSKRNIYSYNWAACSLKNKTLQTHTATVLVLVLVLVSRETMQCTAAANKRTIHSSKQENPQNSNANTRHIELLWKVRIRPTLFILTVALELLFDSHWHTLVMEIV